MKLFLSSTIAIVVAQSKFEQTMADGFDPDKYPDMLGPDEIGPDDIMTERSEPFFDETVPDDLLDARSAKSELPDEIGIEEAPEEVVVAERYTKRANQLRGGNKCSKNKKVTLFKFCNMGTDPFEDASHKFYLNGFSDTTTGAYSDGECRAVGLDPKIITPEDKLKVGIREFDDFHEDDHSYTMPSSFWYDHTCDTYDIVLSRNSEGIWSGCYAPSGTDAGVTPTDLGMSKCEDGYEIPPDSFVWFVMVQPVHIK